MPSSTACQFAALLLLQVLLLVRPQCPALTPRKDQFTADSQALLCEASCTFATGFQSFSFGSIRRDYYTCCEGEIITVSRILQVYTCPGAVGPALPPGSAGSTTTVAPTVVLTAPVTAAPTEEETGGGCPAISTSSINNFQNPEKVCLFECTFGFGFQGVSAGTVTNEVYSCCEGYEVVVVSPILDIYRCE